VDWGLVQKIYSGNNNSKIAVSEAEWLRSLPLVGFQNFTTSNSKNWHNYRELCQLLELLVVKFDVIVLSEIWSTNINFYCNILPGYSLHYHIPRDSHIGGIGMFISNSIDYQVHNSLSNRIEDLWFEINKNNKKYIIGGIYRHPNQQIEEFKQHMDIVLGTLANQKYPCIIAGDINIDLTKCNDNRDTAEYVDTLLTNNFMPAIILPTRITSRTASLIDHIYYSKGTKHSDCVTVKAGNFVVDISDHLPNYLLLLNRKQHETNERPMIRIFSSKSKENFINELQETDWTSVNNLNNVDEAYNSFIGKLTDAFDRNFKLRLHGTIPKSTIPKSTIPKSTIPSFL
jgi:hypothetical protein